MGISCGVLESTADNLMRMSEYGMVICFYLISIYGLKQPAIFSDNTRTISIEMTHPLNNSENVKSIIDTQEQQVVQEEKYQKPSLTAELSIRGFQELNRFIAQHRLYLDPELSLSQLALESGFAKHHLSQVINCLRVEHADNNLNILDISIASGFNFRSAFYNAFKKDMQLTPSQFKKLPLTESCAV